MSKIHYIGFYGDKLSYEENRYICPAGANKMDYIIHALTDAGHTVSVISPAWVNYKNDTKFKFFKERAFFISENAQCSTPASINCSGKLCKVVLWIYSKIWLLWHILTTVKRSDKVLVYHSLFYSNEICWCKKLIGFELVLEVEELYSIVFSMTDKLLKKELQIVDLADSYIFPNNLMKNLLKVEGKPIFIIYGSYSIENYETKKQFNDGKIHLVYAGIIDTLKNGAFNALSATRFLSDAYVLHILGFGQQKDIDLLKSEIGNIDSQCTVYYEGQKTGEEYIDFMRSCHIGLSTQRNEGKYLEYTFPSKVLSYMSMGLTVVTARIDCLTKSSLNSLMNFYDYEDGESIAHTILSVDLNKREQNVEKIKELDQELIQRFKKM